MYSLIETHIEIEQEMKRPKEKEGTVEERQRQRRKESYFQEGKVAHLVTRRVQDSDF